MSTARLAGIYRVAPRYPIPIMKTVTPNAREVKSSFLGVITDCLLILW